MKQLAWILVFGLIAHIIWTGSAFVSYSFTGPGDKPTLIGSLIASVLIISIMYFIAKWFNQKKQINPFILGIFSAVFTLVLNFLITIPNETTHIFTGYWVLYITFIAVFIGSWLGAKVGSNTSNIG